MPARFVVVLIFLLQLMAAHAEGVFTPRTFGHLSNYGSQLSADGGLLLHVQRFDRKTSVILSKADGSNPVALVKPEENLTIYFATWAHKANRIVVSAGMRGGGVDLLFAYDVSGSTGDAGNLLQRIDLLAPLHAPEMYFAAANARDNLAFPIVFYRDNERPAQHSIYQLDLASGMLAPVEREGQVIPFSFAACPGQTFGLMIDDASGGSGQGVAYLLKKNGTWNELRRVSGESRAAGTSLASCSEEKREIYFLDADSRDFVSLAVHDLDTLRSLRISADKGDIVDISFNRQNGVPDSYTTDYESPQWHAVSDAANTLGRNLGNRFSDGIESSSCSTDGARCILSGAMKGQGEMTYLWTSAHPGDLLSLFASRGDMEGWHLQAQHAQRIQARDGTELNAYLTMPSRTCPPNGCKTVMLVHGGPGERDSVRADPVVQWLAARGYLVLTVNYRGSHGVGRELEALGNQQWGLKMQDDLDDVARWSIDHGLSESGKIAFVGNGYGGFASLNAVMREGYPYACAVSMSGMTNLADFVSQRARAMPEIEQDLFMHIGNPSSADMRKRLYDQSPIGKVRTLNVPVLLTAVENDPYAPLADALEFESQVGAAGKASLLSFFTLKGTGHVFNSETSEQLTWRLVDRFLARCMRDDALVESGEIDSSAFARSKDGLHLLH